MHSATSRNCSLFPTTPNHAPRFSDAEDPAPGESSKAEQEADGSRPVGLAARIQRGDTCAEAELVERFGPGLMRALNRYTRGRPEAEDLFQDTFRLALEKLRRGELRDPKRLRRFLMQIARNLVIDYYRKIRRRRTEADSEAVHEASTVPSRQLRRLLRSEDIRLVWHVIDTLPNERDRRLLLRFYLAEEDKIRIATDLGLSSLQFNRALYRARQRYQGLYLKLSRRPSRHT